MKKHYRFASLLLCLTLLLGLFEFPADAVQRRRSDRRYQHHSRTKGTLIGGAIGAVGGALVGGRKGALIGGGAGAGTGYLVQRHRNNKQRRRYRDQYNRRY